MTTRKMNFCDLFNLLISRSAPHSHTSRLPSCCSEQKVTHLFSTNKKSPSICKQEGTLHSRGEQPARLLGQSETGQQADDQVHDEEQQVAEPPVETHGDTMRTRC